MRSISKYSIYNENLFENIKEYLEKNKKGIILERIEIVTKNKRKRILVYMKCTCGNKFKKTFDDISRKDRNTLCLVCSRKERARKRKKSKVEMFNFIESNGYEIIDKSKHYLRNEYIEVLNKDGYKGFISYNGLRANKQMTIFNMSINKKNYLYNVDIYSKVNNLGVKAISFSDKDKWTRQGLVLECPCGKQFETSIASFQNGKTKCDECSHSISSYEKAIVNFLEQYKIKYVRQYRFNDCRNVLPLPFDFYLVDDDKLMEIDGEGHYFICHHKGISLEKAKETFLRTKENDMIKNKYCDLKNIPLLRISYDDMNSGYYKEKILKFIKE